MRTGYIYVKNENWHWWHGGSKFEIDFPPECDATERGLIVGGVLLMDTTYWKPNFAILEALAAMTLSHRGVIAPNDD